ncbi:MAG TPA: hypothetical protein VKK31_29270 [Thermoanaerobaculia bacterium]|nr:hypothetical protein [Thermoanaerobaculia bacterium]
MKKVVLFALLLAAVAGVASAQTYVEPKLNTYYQCNYTNYTGPATPGGFSIFINPSGSLSGVLWATEKFQVPYLTGWDNWRVAFAKPVNRYIEGYLISTTVEFTSPDGQCKATKISQGGNRIDFNNCTTGYSRVCTTY